MPTITLRAHFDGSQIVLDEPYELPPHSLLMVTILSDGASEQSDDPRWISISARGLARAYSDSEPDYAPTDGDRQ